MCVQHPLFAAAINPEVLHVNGANTSVMIHLDDDEVYCDIQITLNDYDYVLDVIEDAHKDKLLFQVFARPHHQTKLNKLQITIIHEDELNGFVNFSQIQNARVAIIDFNHKMGCAKNLLRDYNKE